MGECIVNGCQRIARELTHILIMAYQSNLPEFFQKQQIKRFFTMTRIQTFRNRFSGCIVNGYVRIGCNFMDLDETVSYHGS